MARYKAIDMSPRFLAVDLSRQFLPGTFEHALNELLDHDIDLSDLDSRYCNDETGATAYPPAMLLKVILFAYSQGIVSSRGIGVPAVSTSPSSRCRGTVHRTSPRLPAS
jgi:transposase